MFLKKVEQNSQVVMRRIFVHEELVVPRYNRYRNPLYEVELLDLLTSYRTDSSLPVKSGTFIIEG